MWCEPTCFRREPMTEAGTIAVGRAREIERASRTSLADLMSESTVRVFSLGCYKFELPYNYMIGIMYCKVNALLLE